MLPASNRGAGMNIGFPDVCLTPAGPAVVPIPYPNLAMNAQALGFSPVVKVSMVNALNLGSKIPMTSGDEAGSASPIKGAGAYTMGNPLVNIDRLPGINLVCPTTGNNMNNPLGAVLVPSAVNVTYCRAGATGATGEHVDVAELAAIAGELRGGGVSAARRGAVALVRIRHFSPGVSTEVFRHVAALGAGLVAVVIDLRANPGGELDAAAHLAGTLLPKDALIARTVDDHGDTRRFVAPGSLLSVLPTVLVVDGRTASAAELFAAALQAHARAIVVGEITFGKGAAQTVAPPLAGGEATRATVARWIAGPEDAAIEAPVRPDLEIDATREDPIAAALSLASELAAAL